MSDKNESFVLTGKAFWAHLRKPNDLSGKYQLDLSIDEETKKKLHSLNFPTKQEDNPKHLGTPNDRGTYVTLKRNPVTKTGDVMSAPPIVDGKKNPVPDSINIGNGSVVNVKTKIFDWSFKGKKGKGLSLDAVQIKALVEYSTPTFDLFQVEDGYEVSNSSLRVSGNDTPPFDVDEDPFS